MECPESDATGLAEPALAGRVVNVDHHPGNTRYGALNLIDLPAAAVGEIVADLLDFLQWPIGPDTATNLWVSLVSDTGSFRYSNTTPKALALGARLVAAGARPGPVNEFLFEAAPLSSLRLEALVLGTLALHAGGAVATVELPRRFLAESGARESDTEGLVNRARGIDGVKAAALLREGEEGEIRCSLRSKGTVDVRSVAALHGGGGHRNAAGCRFPGTLESAKTALVAEVAAAVAADAGAAETRVEGAPRRGRTASSSWTSRRGSRRTTSWTSPAGCSGRAASATRGRSTPPRPASSSSASAARAGCSPS